MSTVLLDQHRPSQHLPNDAQSDPEPAVPSLPEPDPGVFHHEPEPLLSPVAKPQPEPTT